MKPRPKPPPGPGGLSLWDVIEHNHKAQEYTLKNKATGQVRTVAKELFLEIAKEQKSRGKNENSGWL